jgi:hypothetical protein
VPAAALLQIWDSDRGPGAARFDPRGARIGANSLARAPVITIYGSFQI